MTEPLTDGQKLFNQRLMAEHSMTQDAAQNLWESLGEHHAMGGPTLDKTIAACNRQLETIGLGIVAISQQGKRVYAMVNKDADEIIKTSTEVSVSEANYSRLVLQKLVEDETCDRAMLINLRSELDDPTFKLDMAEHCLQRLLEDKWIQEEPGQGKKRRGSLKATLILAPRSYMELSYLFVNQFGMNGSDLPQQLYFR